jgi:hypothetical protein
VTSHQPTGGGGRHMQAWRRSTGLGSAQVLLTPAPHIDDFPSIERLSGCVKGVESQPMSLTNADCGRPRIPHVIGQPKRTRLPRQSRYRLGTFWAHSLSTEVNSSESQCIISRLGAGSAQRPAPRNRSVPGSSTEKVLVRGLIERLSTDVEPARPKAKSTAASNAPPAPWART